MNIITALPRYSDGQINEAFVREIKTGFQLEREMESFRVKAAQQEAEELRREKTNPVLGKCVGVIPERDFFRLIKKYGHATVHSKDFIKYFNRKFPDLSPNRV